MVSFGNTAMADVAAAAAEILTALQTRVIR